MTNKDLLLLVQKICQVDQTHCSVLLNTLCRLMAQAGVEQVPVTLHGLGTFTSHKHPEYIQEDPSNGRQTLYPPRITYRMQAEEGNETQDDILVQQLADTAKLPLTEANSFISALVQTIIAQVERGEEVEVHGLGRFRVIASRQGDIQRTAFNPDEQMRLAVNAPFSCFEPVVIRPANEESSSSVNLEVPVTEESMKDTIAEEDSMDEQFEVSPVYNHFEPEEVTRDNEVTIVSTEAEGKAESSVEEHISEENIASEKVDLQSQKSTSTSCDHQEDDCKDADEEPQKTLLIRTLSVLLVIAIVALLWFVFRLEPEPQEAEVVDNNLELTAQTENEQNPLSEVFFGNDDTIEVAEIELQKDKEEKTVELIVENTLPNKNAEAIEPKVEANNNTVKPVKEEKPEKTTLDNNQIEQKAPEKKTQDANPEQLASYGRLKNADGSYATHKLEKGGRLTLVALEHYGDKFFWPYIFEVNKDKLKNPSLVQPGMVLYLPDPKVFDIDANDPESLAKAKAKARQYLQ